MTIHPQIIDLTEMFGAGNEPSTVDEFKALFPKDYYPYNAGEETTVSAVNGDPYQYLSVTFPDGQTVYGGKYEFVGGNLKPYKEYDSYNGETLTGRWMSSIDKYVSGTTPTIGAQVVDLDGFETTVQLTPQPISTLAGENNVWSNGDSVEITYKAQAS